MLMSIIIKNDCKNIQKKKKTTKDENNKINS